jgi:hypothetical protein
MKYLLFAIVLPTIKLIQTYSRPQQLLQSYDLPKSNPNSQILCTCPKHSVKVESYQFSSKPFSVPAQPQNQKYCSTYSLSYTTNNNYRECISNVTKLLSYKKVKENEGPGQFTYLEHDGLLMVGFCDGRVHVYREEVLVERFK